MRHLCTFNSLKPKWRHECSTCASSCNDLIDTVWFTLIGSAERANASHLADLATSAGEANKERPCGGSSLRYTLVGGTGDDTL
jgi:hypothetical protein